MSKNKLRHKAEIRKKGSYPRRTSKRIKEEIKQSFREHWIYKIFKFLKGGKNGK